MNNYRSYLLTGTSFKEVTEAYNRFFNTDRGKKHYKVLSDTTIIDEGNILRSIVYKSL